MLAFNVENPRGGEINMYQHHHCPTQVSPIRTNPIVCPPQYRCHDTFIPREVPFIHPIVNVNRQHYADFPRHYFTESNVTIPAPPVQSRPGFGFPQFGGRPF